MPRPRLVHRVLTPARICFALLVAASGGRPAAAQDSVQAVRPARPDTLPPRQIVRRVATVNRWNPDSLGNHRVVIHADSTGDAVAVLVPWRRRDAHPERVAAILIDAATKQRVRNVARMDVARDEAWFVFQARSAPGDYYLYYLPYQGTVTSNYPKITYRPVDAVADPQWVNRNGLDPQQGRLARWKALPRAAVTAYEAIDATNMFTDMEFIASRAELTRLTSRYAWAQFMLFADDRQHAIRMTDDIPARWAARGAFQAFRGTSARGEFYTFQIGVWAHARALDSVSLSAGDLTSRTGDARIPASAFVSFNTGGVDWRGRPFTRTVSVPRGKVQALWLGVDVPRDAAPGEYQADVVVSARGVRPQTQRVVIRVTEDSVANHGDDAPERLTRLRWLNSQIAADEQVVRPFTPMRVTGSTVAVLGRTLTFGADGLPTSITSAFTPELTGIGRTSREVLAAPMRLDVTDAAGVPMTWQTTPARVTHRADGAVAWDASRRAGRLLLQLTARMEMDGVVEYTVALRAADSLRLGDVRLELPIAASVAKYLMGLGQKGGRRPPTLDWTWDVAKKNQDAVWIGDVNAGVQLTLKDEHYVRPLNTNFYLSKPLVLPASWGTGGCAVRESGLGSRDSGSSSAGVVHLSCYSGPRVLAAGDSLRFDFRLMVSPFKPLDTAGQWGTRYFHAFVPVDSAAKRGANTINVHHATRINPWINYPFLEPAQMKAYVDSAHGQKMKVKIYYTVRELTNRAPELFALRSLGDEVLSHGPGGGYAWLQEHLGGDYIAGWHVPEIKDAAVVTSGVSRWHNFYVEGLDWLVKHVGIDGLYIDDVAFDRTTMKRVRKVLERGNPGALIDLHSANQFNERDGFASSANLYLEHFPYLDRLWFGEYFDYDSPPDYWLVELSGIPFGLMGEMLEKGGNPWRGMLFGMTNRMPWSGDPSPIWKAWDDFGIARSRMIGWWSPTAPVRTDSRDVLATSYVRDGRTMVALASWAARAASVKLTVDWKALGLDPARVRLRAPAIPGFQEAATFDVGGAIPVEPGKGWLLILEAR